MWSPNPFAIALLLLRPDQLQLPSGQRRDYATWAEAQALLEDGFKVKANMLFDPEGTKPPPFQVFRDFLQQFQTPQTLDVIVAAIKQQPLGQAAIDRFGEDAIRRVLPFLVPVADHAAFTKPGAPAAPNEIAAYQALGPFMDGGASYLDPKQGMVADCYLLSSMISIAWAQPAKWQEYLDKACSHSPAGESYRFEFTQDDETVAPAFDVRPWVPVVAPNQPYYAKSSKNGEAWPSLVEKAFVMNRCKRAPDDPVPADYQFIGDVLYRWYPMHACHMLIGGHADCSSETPLRSLVRNRCPDGSTRLVTTVPTMATTHVPVTVAAMTDKRLTWGNTGLVNGHAYAVLGMMTRGDVEYVVLRNPHGVSSTDILEYAKGEWEPGPGENGAATVVLNQGGVFALPVDWFEACFFRVDWVDLKPAHP